MGRLQDRVAIITGAGRGIGNATARRFAAEGARVWLADLNGDQVTAAARELRESGYDAHGVEVNVAERAQVEAMVESVIAEHQRVDILINNAGVIRDNLVHKMTDEDWHTVLAVHLTGTFLCSQAVQRHMVRQQYGRIVNLSSTSALGNRGQLNYAAAKAGLQGMTKTLAIELGKFGVTCNAVAPGFIETDMTRATAERIGMTFDAFVEAARQTIPAGNNDPGSHVPANESQLRPDQ